MEAGALWDVLRRELESIRQQYDADGRGDEFDRAVAVLKARGRWPFGE